MGAETGAQATGIVFNIQHYAIHDGPGIRTTVFLKGCPLRCLWCQNPESHNIRPELFFISENCTGCSRCLDLCPNGAIQLAGGKSVTDRELCRGRGDCCRICPNDARSLVGRAMTVQDAFSDVIADEIFYQNSGGGATLSGGEPLAQPEFSEGFLKLCKEAGIHTALETSGYAKWEIIDRLFKYVDLVLYDFKHMDPIAHRRYTGVSNEVILANAQRICHELQVPMKARIPIVPGLNDSPENIENTARFIVDKLGDSIAVHLLPYHRLGESKYERMGVPERKTVIDPPTDEHVFLLKEQVEAAGLSAYIGG